MVYNPIWLQIICYAAIVGFPCLAGYIFYLGYEVYQKSGFFSGAIFFAFALGVSYISYIGFILAKYVGAKVEFGEDGFRVKNGNLSSVYSWSEVGGYKDYPSSQILKLFCSKGNTIYVVDYLSYGYKEFSEIVRKKVI